MGYPGITQTWDSRICGYTSTDLSQDDPRLSQDVPGYLRTTQTLNSRICGYLHRLIPGYPGIIPGCPEISQTWDSRICGYPQAYPRISQDVLGYLRPGTLGSVATSTGLCQDIPGLSQVVPGYPRITLTWDIPG